MLGLVDPTEGHCALCPTGQFQDEVGMASCKNCTAESIKTIKRERCESCIPGKTSVKASAECDILCTAGTGGYIDASDGEESVLRVLQEDIQRVMALDWSGDIRGGLILTKWKNILTGTLCKGIIT